MKESQTITQVTRRKILDELRLADIDWAGRLPEPDFLSRLYNLKEMHSHDGRYDNAYGDIYKHRVNNRDGDRDWVFTDERFNLLHANDEEFLQFLCEMVHPVVRPDQEEGAKIVAILNKHLAIDGWQIEESAKMSGHSLYAARRGLAVPVPALVEAQQIADRIGTDYVARQLTRMQSALVAGDGALAVGTAKEFVETICKTVLEKRKIPIEHDISIGKLVRTTARIVSNSPRAKLGEIDQQAIDALLGHLGGIADRVGEVRNQAGTGHGQAASSSPIDLKIARLVVSSATALSVFIFECEVG